MQSLSITFLFIFYLSVVMKAQEIDYLLNGTQHDNEIYLSWTIQKGNTCSGTDIERAFDTTQFERIGSIGGICGNSDFPSTYSFTDIRPIPNSINYYRLVFGGRQYSSIIPIYYVSYNDFGYSVNNSSSSTTIYFMINPLLQKIRFILSDFNGRILEEVNEILDNKVEFENDRLHHGFYVFMLTDEKGNKLQRGKIFID